MDKFCKFCGAQHTDKDYPKLCTRCKQITWINPLPVAVLLQPIHENESYCTFQRTGLLVGRRTIQPGKGEWGLVGGFIDPKDNDVIDAARREFWEEMGEGKLKLSDSDFLLDIVSSYNNGSHLLIFVENKASINELYLMEEFVPNSECDAVRVIYKPEKLCFESHTKAVHWWFTRNDPKNDYYA